MINPPNVISQRLVTITLPSSILSPPDINSDLTIPNPNCLIAPDDPTTRFPKHYSPRVPSSPSDDPFVALNLMSAGSLSMDISDPLLELNTAVVAKSNPMTNPFEDPEPSVAMGPRDDDHNKQLSGAPEILLISENRLKSSEIPFKSTNIEPADLPFFTVFSNASSLFSREGGESRERPEIHGNTASVLGGELTPRPRNVKEVPVEPTRGETPRNAGSREGLSVVFSKDGVSTDEVQIIGNSETRQSRRPISPTKDEILVVSAQVIHRGKIVPIAGSPLIVAKVENSSDTSTNEPVAMRGPRRPTPPPSKRSKIPSGPPPTRKAAGAAKPRLIRRPTPTPKRRPRNDENKEGVITPTGDFAWAGWVGQDMEKEIEARTIEAMELHTQFEKLTGGRSAMGDRGEFHPWIQTYDNPIGVKDDDVRTRVVKFDSDVIQISPSTSYIVWYKQEFPSSENDEDLEEPPPKRHFGRLGRVFRTFFGRNKG